MVLDDSQALYSLLAFLGLFIVVAALAWYYKFHLKNLKK